MSSLKLNFFEVQSMRYNDEDCDTDSSEKHAATRCQDETGSEAFGRLIERYGSQLYWYIRSKVRSDDDADEAMAETWRIAFQSRLNVRDPDAFLGWLMGIARRSCIAIYRKKTPQLIDDDVFWRSRVADPLSDPAVLAHFEQDPLEYRRVAREVVEGHPIESQRAAIARFGIGTLLQHPRGIAQVLGVSLHNVNEWLAGIELSSDSFTLENSKFGSQIFVANKPIRNEDVAMLIDESASSVKARTWRVNQEVRRECDGLDLWDIIHFRNRRLALHEDDQPHAAQHAHQDHGDVVLSDAPFGLETRRQSPHSSPPPGQLSGGLDSLPS